ncbi:hypothetical protein DENIT_70018 [Pseudomonas veronii]|nr:hypothetical protein DENIT_70018 [Pseudomonas veronii]
MREPIDSYVGICSKGDSNTSTFTLVVIILNDLLIREADCFTCCPRPGSYFWIARLEHCAHEGIVWHKVHLIKSCECPPHSFCKVPAQKVTETTRHDSKVACLMEQA